MIDPTHIDATDRRILEVLQEDGRITNSALAEVVHLSPSACLRRMRRLEAEGVIEAYVALVDRTRVGRGTTVFVEIALEGQSDELLAEFEDAVREVPAIVSCHLMTGMSDYLIQVVAADVEDYERIHRHHLGTLPHVARLRSSFALRTVRSTTAVPLD